MPRLEVRIIAARNLPDPQVFGMPDPYVKISLEHQKHKTSVQENNINPKWDEVFKFQIADENSSQLKMELWNSNVIKDDFLGEYVLSLSGLYRGVERDEWFLLKQCKTNSEIRVKILAIDFGLLPAAGTPALTATTSAAVQSVGMPAPAPVAVAPVAVAPMPAPQYVAPPPQPQYAAPAPQPQYAAPAPQPQYAAPAPQPQYAAPAPQPQYAAPAPAPYGVPPQPQYAAAPPAPYGAPQYPPAPVYAAPPAPVYAAPPPPPPAPYGAPGYPAPQPGYPVNPGYPTQPGYPAQPAYPNYGY